MYQDTNQLVQNCSVFGSNSLSTRQEKATKQEAANAVCNITSFSENG
jgi:hypothetical protein